MKNYFNYLVCENKRIWKRLPVAALCMVILAVVIGGFVFVAQSYWYHSDQMALFQVGLAVEDTTDQVLIERAMDLVEDTASVSKMLTFYKVSEQEGLSKMKKKELQALIVIPVHTAENIMNGKNTPAFLYLNQDTEAGTISILMRELTSCGVKLLDIAQAQDYVLYDIYKEQGSLEEVIDDNWKLDQYNLSLTLNREDVFKQQMISEVNHLTLRNRYIASGILLFFLLSGIIWCSYFEKNRSVELLLKRNGIGKCAQYIGKIIDLWILYFMLYLLLIILFRQGLTVGIVLATQLALITILFFGIVYLITNTKESGIVLLVVSSLGMLYCAGGIVPSPLLPAFVRNVGQLMPADWMIQQIGGILQ